MKIALTHPYCWPYVRRGAERFLAELGKFLTGHGHSVYTVSSKPGRSVVEQCESGQRFLKRQVWTPALERIRLSPAHAFSVDAYCQVRKIRPDLVQSMHFMDALGSAMAARSTDHKSIYYVTGPPIPGYQPRVSPDRWFLRQAIRLSDLVLAPSQYVAGQIRHYYGVDATVAPPPVDTALFSPALGRRSKRPLVLGMAAFDDPRKGALPLVQAFARVKVRYPGAVLRLCGQIAPAKRRDLLSRVPTNVACDIEFPGVGRLEDLPDQYRQAWVTVQPAKWESYSLVLLESWACGTPAVAAKHGGLAELITDPNLGDLFEPGGSEDDVEVKNIEGLAAAIARALAEADPNARGQQCRLKAECYSWDRLGPRFLDIYAELLRKPSGSPTKSRRTPGKGT